MKILHIIPSFGLGGMEKVLCTIVNRAAPDSQHTILALDNNRAARQWLQRLQPPQPPNEPNTPTRHEHNTQEDSSIDFIDFPAGLKRIRHFQAVSAKLRQARPDILMTYGWGATDAIWIGRLLGIKHILHSEHGVNIDEAHTTHWKRELVRKLVYRLAARVIVVTHEYSALMQQRYGLSAEQVVRIPNGIDTQRYAPAAFERHSVRRDLGFERTDFVAGFVGRLDPIKNLDLLLDILACAAQRSPQLRLLIVGDGPDRERIERVCRDKHLHNRIVFAGPQVDVLPYLRAMDTFLLTSFREQMPLTLLEAMAVGIPAIHCPQCRGSSVYY